MKPIRIFHVVPSLPPELEQLRTIAYNLRWSWNHEAIELFRRLDSEMWESCGHNPVLLLGSIDQMKLENAARNEAFLAHVDRVGREFDDYMQARLSWFRRMHNDDQDTPTVAYFSAEFGITECLSIFAGGLGMLAGDHLKSASDLGVPLTGVGLLYQQGYFRQYLNQAGWQQEAYENNDFHNLPIAHLRKPDGSPLTISVPYPGRDVTAQIWKAQVGRLTLLLLDTNHGANRREDHDITDQLYGGDREMRIQQEIMLGIGGYRALEAVGLEPTVYHMNEGHSAFLALERVRRLMETRHLSFDQARGLASSSLVFTTHTPVEAGHDYFTPEQMDRYFGDYARALGLSRQEFLGLGRRNASDQGDFCMTVLALRLASYRNGVSKLHGQVTRRMWKSVWPSVPESEVPIRHITNGVHFRTWISAEMNLLYDRYLGPAWREEPAQREIWQRVESIPADELWRTHERRRERLVGWARVRVRRQREARGASRAEIQAADEVLDPEALTIGFARRFATYKRATLLLRDMERLGRLLSNPDRPVQFIFAGKAHPQDTAGKELIRRVVEVARTNQYGRRWVFIENYDPAVSRYMVEGVDVWLNTPLRPLEASGTSGMKAAANGALNLSTLDGWWDEAWREQHFKSDLIGWAIGRGEIYDNPDYQDQVEAEALYDLLERDIVPTFFDRGPDRLPRLWIARMKASIGRLCYFFNTHRMVKEYTEDFYLKAHARFRTLSDNDSARAKQLAAWLARVSQSWPQLRIEKVEGGPDGSLVVGGSLRSRVLIHLGNLSPADVRVEMCMGRLDAEGEIADPEPVEMSPGETAGSGQWFETTAAVCCRSGLHGYTVRVLPRHPDLSSPFIPSLIAWADDSVLAQSAGR